jgi:hypothetical protein
VRLLKGARRWATWILVTVAVVLGVGWAIVACAAWILSDIRNQVGG